MAEVELADVAFGGDDEEKEELEAGSDAIVSGYAMQGAMPSQPQYPTLQVESMPSAPFEGVAAASDAVPFNNVDVAGVTVLNQAQEAATSQIEARVVSSSAPLQLGAGLPVEL